jgi:Kef-type K+ transport system membrane component KefB
VMLNCRGLTELIVLSMGLQLGVLNQELFAMFMVMALLTTAMTGPLLRRVVPASVNGIAVDLHADPISPGR